MQPINNIIPELIRIATPMSRIRFGIDNIIPDIKKQTAI